MAARRTPMQEQLRERVVWFNVPMMILVFTLTTLFALSFEKRYRQNLQDAQDHNHVTALLCTLGDMIAYLMGTPRTMETVYLGCIVFLFVCGAVWILMMQSLYWLIDPPTRKVDIKIVPVTHIVRKKIVS